VASEQPAALWDSSGEHELSTIVGTRGIVVPLCLLEETQHTAWLSELSAKKAITAHFAYGVTCSQHLAGTGPE